MEDGKLSKKEELKLKTVADLSTLVKERYEAAANARMQAGVSELLTQCRRAALGQPLTGQHANPELPVVCDITGPILRGLTAVLSDTLTASATDLFTVEPTALPTLSNAESEMIVGLLRRKQALEVQLGIDSDPQLEIETEKVLMDAAGIAVDDAARESAQRLQKVIKDTLQENGFDAAIRAGLQDLVGSLAMVIKAPSPSVKKVKKWGENGRLVFVDELVRGVERIDPMNLYPAPNAADIQSADYVIEVRNITMNELAVLAAADGYDSNEVVRVFAEYPNGFKLSTIDSSVDNLKNPDSSVVVTPNTTVFGYDVLVMYGRVNGALMMQFGIDGIDERMLYDAEIMTIGGCVIRAVLNADTSGRRPFYVVSYDPVPGSFWGRCPVSHIIPLQRAATSAFVAMLGDVATSGIYIEVDPTRLHDDEVSTKEAVRPRVVRVVKPNNTGITKRAYDFYPVESGAAGFRAVIEDLEKRAYDLVGLQRFAVGQTTGVGTVGRTSGGLQTLLAQAGKGMKQVLRNIENHVVEPVVQSFVDWELMWGGSGLDISGDVRVTAKGLTEVAENAGQAEDLQWALQSLSGIADKVNPETGKTLIPATAFTHILYQLFKAKGIPTDGVFPPNFESYGKIEGIPDQADTPVLGQPGILDGRSKSAVNAIAASNDPMGVKGATE